MDQRCIRAVQTVKKMIAEATFSTILIQDIPIISSTAASSYDLGAVLSHRLHDGSEAHLANATFNQSLYGQIFELIPDNQCLLSLFNPQKKSHVLAAKKIRRWTMILMVYDYTVKYRSSKELANADALSRLWVGSNVDPDNGLAERFVKTFKTSINKQTTDGYDLNEAGCEFFLAYRSTPFDDKLKPLELLHEYNQKNRWLNVIVIRSVDSRTYEEKMGVRIAVLHRNQNAFTLSRIQREETQNYEPDTTEKNQRVHSVMARESDTTCGHVFS
ncbi:hypothetical protein RF11_15177 [Thelohanellus kitauei]|uniref:Uncharacterized protein n=1 Tax=Thelohanellus kitauei TaxID=669202 RepID=A0A0C2J4D1_THEKT|nr:hypothetical protein RF11_15177 [Thelohanellus kitauei]